MTGGGGGGSRGSPPPYESLMCIEPTSHWDKFETVLKQFGFFVQCGQDF